MAFRFRPEFRYFWLASREAGPLGSGFSGFLNFGDFALAAEETRLSGMAGRYAQALFALSEETGTTDKTAADLAAFAELSASSADMQRFIKSPVFSAEEQVGALDAILARAGITGIAANFLKLVAAKRRLFAIFDMIRDFNVLNDARKGITRANVTVAEPLNIEHAVALRSALIDISGGGEVRMVVKVDPSIIGGLIVQLGSRMVDSSLKTKLQFNSCTHERGRLMEIRAAEISAILKNEIANFGNEAEVTEVGDGIARVYGLDNVQVGFGTIDFMICAPRHEAESLS